MPERRGRDPNPQIPLLEYRYAVRFPDEPTSNKAYEATRRVLYEEPCDLSVYRTALLPNITWHILVLGRVPEDRVKERIYASLDGGEAVELPEEVWRAFNQRRLDSAGIQPWTERRHFGGRRLR
jgi:hypothetical protein